MALDLLNEMNASLNNLLKKKRQEKGFLGDDRVKLLKGTRRRLWHEETRARANQ